MAIPRPYFPGHFRVSRAPNFASWRWVSVRRWFALLNARRMTLTLPVLDTAMRVVFLVVGEEKAEILHAVLQERGDPPYPTQLVQPRGDGLKLFLVDQAAAALLDPAGSLKPAPLGKIAGPGRAKPGRGT